MKDLTLRLGGVESGLEARGGALDEGLRVSGAAPIRHRTDRDGESMDNGRARAQEKFTPALREGGGAMRQSTLAEETEPPLLCGFE